MMTSKHTPGPWKCIKYPKVFSISAESGRQIAIMTEHHGDCPMVPMSQFERSERDAADARLIAAAPDMLAALKLIAEAEDNGALAVVRARKDAAPGYIQAVYGAVAWYREFAYQCAKAEGRD